MTNENKINNKENTCLKTLGEEKNFQLRTSHGVTQ